MSDEPPARKTEVRAARVWQPTELMGSSERTQKGFIPLRWATSSSQDFWVQEIRDITPVKAPAVQFAKNADEPMVLADMPQPAIAAGPDGELATNPYETLSNELVERVRAEAYAQGLAESRDVLRAEIQAEVASSRSQDTAMVQALQHALNELKRSPEPFFEPLKRLALHLAEQLVLAELALDARAIDRLVQRCVDDLASSNESVILVELNPGDLELLEAQRERAGTGAGPAIKLQPNVALMPGSVRASANDAVVDDLIEHRLTALARDLSLDVSRWQAHSAFDSERLAAERSSGQRGVEDARPRMSPIEPLVDTPVIDDLLEESEDEV